MADSIQDIIRIRIVMLDTIRDSIRTQTADLQVPTTNGSSSSEGNVESHSG